MTTARAQSLPGRALRDRTVRDLRRNLPEETPVALVFNGTTQAVMMASPADLEDFGRGFALTEGIVERLDQIESLEVQEHDDGAEVQLWLTPDRAEAFQARRRSMLGPVGCGLCGIDSIDEALRDVPPVTADLTLTLADIDAAAKGLTAHQPLHDLTRAVHAAAFYRPGQGILAAREDVGRHNALDKLVGALAAQAIPASKGALVLTSRVSVDMVQKAAMAGAPVVIAVSAPTARAVRLADQIGLTLVTFARGEGCEIFTHPHRIAGAADVA